jgi:hypothetical protein
LLAAIVSTFQLADLASSRDASHGKRDAANALPTLLCALATLFNLPAVHRQEALTPPTRSFP